MEEHGRLEEELGRSQKKVTDLQADVQKLEGYKSMLEGKLSKMAKEVKDSSAKIKSLEGELQMAQDKLKVAEEELKKAEAAMVPESDRIHTLRAILEECNLECVTKFDSGFNTAIAQIQVLHPGLDLFGMHLDKIVVNGQVVDAERDGAGPRGSFF